MTTYSFTDDELKKLINDIAIALIENSTAEVSASNYEVTVTSVESSLGMEDALQIAGRAGKPELFHILYTTNVYISNKGD